VSDKQVNAAVERERVKRERWRKWREDWNVQTRGVGCRVDHSTYSELFMRSRRNGTTIAEMLRAYIEWGLENDDR
jgi:hypothetical protein